MVSNAGYDKLLCQHYARPPELVYLAAVHPNMCMQKLGWKVKNPRYECKPPK